MKQLILLGAIFSIVLAACGTDEPPAAVTEPVASDDVVEEAPAPAEADKDETVQVVEESAAEPDEEDKTDKPILLAQAETVEDAGDWTYTEGKHFVRMVPTQPTVGGADKIEVSEFFWYGCGHCLTFEPYINRWAGEKPANVRFVRIPATWNPLVLLHAQLYYTEEVLVSNGKIEDPEAFRAAVFQEYHSRGNRMTSEDSIRALFERFGVSAEDFDNTWKSFEVAQKLRVAQDLARRYAISGVPAVVVNGKYRTGAGEAGGYPELLNVIDELVAREETR